MGSACRTACKLCTMIAGQRCKVFALGLTNLQTFDQRADFAQAGAHGRLLHRGHEYVEEACMRVKKLAAHADWSSIAGQR